MNIEEISLTGKFLYTNPRANLTQTPPVIRNKNDIETIKELQQINFKLQLENKQLKEQINKAIDMCIVTYGGNEDFYVDRIIKIKQELEKGDSNE